MEHATLGTTGRRVSRLGFGGAPAGLKDYLGTYDPSEPSAGRAIRAAVEAALECGVTYFDTAPGYGNGVGEELIGAGLGGASRDIFVATKYGLWQEESLRDSVQASLTRLGRDTLDLVQLHGGSCKPDDVQRILRPGGIADQLDETREEGLVRHIGLTSEDNNDSLYELIRSDRFDVLQICYNLLHQHPYEPTRPFGSMLVAEEHGLGIVTMRGTTSGIFQKWMRAVRPDDDFDHTPALITFVLSNPLVDVALVGMRSAEEVRTNARLADDTIARVDIAALHRKYPPKEVNGRDC